MKLIIDIDKKRYEEIKRIAKAQLELTDKTEAQIIANGTPYEERPQTIACFNCKYNGKCFRDDPCCFCNEQFSEWEAENETGN